MSGPRDHEPIYGFESYRRLARHKIHQYYHWIPKEERESAAALAAAMVLSTYGEETILKYAEPMIADVLREEQNNWDNGQGKRDDGSYGRRQNEFPFANFQFDTGAYYPVIHLGNGAGVGDWTLKVSRELAHREPDEPGKPTQAMQVFHQIMDALLESSPKLQRIKEQWEQCPHRNMTELCAGRDPALPGTVKELTRARTKARKMLEHYEKTGEINFELANPPRQKPGPKPGSTWTQKQREPVTQSMAVLPQPTPERNWQDLLDTQQRKALSKKYEVAG